MTNPKCPVCFGIGFVCENHPQRAWSEIFGCPCGAGMLCKCNHGDRVEPVASGVLVEIMENPTTKHRLR